MLTSEEDSEVRRAVTELQAGVRAEANSRLIFERYYPWVRRFFKRLGHSPQESEDLAQDTFSQVFERIGSFRQDGSFKSWLFAVASNRHRNEHRRWSREKRNAPEISLDASADADVPGQDPAAVEILSDQVFYEQERREALARAMERLPPQMKEVLSLRIGQDLKYREVAVVLGISVETVKAHLFQARQRLRAELGDDYGEWKD